LCDGLLEKEHSVCHKWLIVVLDEPKVWLRFGVVEEVGEWKE